MNFKRRYTLSCKEEELEPLSIVLSSAKQSRKSLDLSGSVLVPKACKALATALQHGSPFTDIRMEDCLIGDDGEFILTESYKQKFYKQGLNYVYTLFQLTSHWKS